MASRDISEAFRREYMVDESIEFLNCGTLGPTLQCAFDATKQALESWMKQGPGAALPFPEARSYLNLMEEQDKARRAVADWMGTSSHNIALLGNVTDGNNAAMQSFIWKAGDRILTSNEEHPAASRPIAEIARRFGVEVDTLTYPRNDGDVERFLNDYRAAIRPETKLVVLSHVSSKTGVMLPLGTIVDGLLAWPEVYLLVDGAHAAGVQTELLHPRIDFYTYPGHKWLFGPVGTGIMYVSDRALESTSTTLAGAPMISAEGEYRPNEDGAWRYEYGTRDWSKMVGLSVAVNFRRQWPEADIVAHYYANNVAFREGFSSECGNELFGNSALISYRTPKATEVCSWLWESQRVLARTVDVDSMRISLGPWLDTARAEAIGRLLGAAVAKFESTSL